MVVTEMVGGTMLGYCAMGSRNSDTPPMRTKTMASTLARTGRSMKNLEIIAWTGPPSRLQNFRGRRRDLGFFRGHLASRDGALVVTDHHPVVRGQALGDLAQRPEELAHLDNPLL